MKKNLTLLSALLVMALCALSLNIHAQCIPAAAATVAGTADAGAGASFTFSAVPTGNVIELVATSADDAFTFDMCSNEADGWADGTSDTNITILDMNDAAATALAYLDDGCTNGAGPEFWGPTFGTWTPPAAGTYYAYVAEWDWAAGYPGNNGSGDPCFGTDGANTYDVVVTVAPPADCLSGVLDASMSPISICPTDSLAIVTDGSETSAGGFGIVFSPQATGMGALDGTFILSGVTFPTSIDADLGGLLSANSLPVFEGEWAVYTAAYSDPANTFGSICSQSADSIMVTFLTAGDPACTGTDVEDVEEVSSFNLAPNPTNGLVNVSIRLEGVHDVRVEIFDLTGRVVATQSRGDISEETFSMDLSAYTDGVYFARFIVDGENSFTERIIKSN